MPASAYDFEYVRMISRLGCEASRLTHDLGAKSTYASSRTTTPWERVRTRSTEVWPCQVPVGELGLTRNFSGASSSASRLVHVQPSAQGCGAGTTSCTWHRGASRG